MREVSPRRVVATGPSIPFCSRAPAGEPSAAELALGGAPPIDDRATAIDELAHVLATDHLSTLEKVRLLEQWRYDVLLREVGAAEGLPSNPEDGVLLQQINRTLLLLRIVLGDPRPIDSCALRWRPQPSVGRFL